MSVPDLAAQGGAGLDPGILSAEVTLWAWDFDRNEFLWSDIEREHERAGFAAAVTFTLD